MGKVALLAAFVMTGCGAFASYSQTREPPHPMAARPPETVEILSFTPARRFIEVGEVSASGGSEEQRMTAVRERAAREGCDAVVVRRGTGLMPVAGIVHTVEYYHGSCLVFVDAGGPPPDPGAVPAAAPADGGS